MGWLTRVQLMKAVCSIGSVGLALAAIVCAPSHVLAAVEGVPPLGERLWVLSGTFHPVVVHFPIALLLLAAIVEFLRLKFKQISPDVAFFSLLLAAGGSVVSAIFGWSKAAEFHGQTLTLHRWLGVGVTVLTVVLAIAAILMRLSPARAVAWNRFQTFGIFIA